MNIRWRTIPGAVELSELIEDIRRDREPAPGLADALAVLRIVERIYEAS
jgi:predicted dehydrogenase